MDKATLVETTPLDKVIAFFYSDEGPLENLAISPDTLVARARNRTPAEALGGYYSVVAVLEAPETLKALLSILAARGVKQSKAHQKFVADSLKIIAGGMRDADEAHFVVSDVGSPDDDFFIYLADCFADA